MKVQTKVGDVVVDALNLGDLLEAVEPMVRQSVERHEQDSPPRQSLVDALVASGALLLALHKKIGALVYQRDQIGIVDAELVMLSEELADAFLGTPEADDSSIVLTP